MFLLHGLLGNQREEYNEPDRWDKSLYKQGC